MPEIKPVQKPLLESDKVVIVMGASFPSMQPAMPPFIEPIEKPEHSKDHEGQWFHIIPSNLQEGAYPHTKQLCVRHQIAVGTVDEIVELFRNQLEVAVEQLLMLKDLPEDAPDDAKEHQALTWANSSRMQEILAPALAANPHPGRAILLPWVADDHPAYKAWEAAKLVAAQRVEQARALSFNKALLAQLKSEDNEVSKHALDEIHAFLNASCTAEMSSRLDSGVIQVNDGKVEGSKLHLRMFGVDIREEDFDKCVDVRSQWLEQLGVGRVSQNPSS